MHLALAAAVCVARAGVVVALNPWVGWYRELPPFREVLFTSVTNNLFLFGFLVGFGHAVLYARRARQREEQLAYAELQARFEDRLRVVRMLNTGKSAERDRSLSSPR